MGRLTNSIGIRLGKKNIWSNFGILTKKDNSIKYINFLKIVSSLLDLGKLQYKKFILAKAILVQEKTVLKLKIFLYKEDGIRYAIKYKKLLKKFFLKRYYLVRRVNNKIKIIKKNTYRFKVKKNILE